MDQNTPRSSFHALCTVGFFAFLSYEWARTPLLSLYAKSLGASEDLVGAVMAASTCTGILVKYPAGILSDMFGRKRLLMIGAFVFGTMPFLYAYTETIPLLMALRLVHGLATAIYAPVALAMVADLFQQRRAEKIGWYTAATRSGRTLGPYAGGLILTHFGFQSAYLLCGISGVISLIFAFALRNPAPVTVPSHPFRHFKQYFKNALKEAGSNMNVLAVSIIGAVEQFALGSIQAFLPLYGKFVAGLREDQIGLLFALQGVSSLLTRPIMGMLSDRLGRKPLILCGVVITAAALTLIPRFDSFMTLAVLSAMFGLGEAIVHTSSSAFVADLSGGKPLGSAMGILGSIMDMGHAAGQFVPGLLIVAFNYKIAFAATAGFLLVCSLAFVVVVRSKREAN